MPILWGLFVPGLLLLLLPADPLLSAHVELRSFDCFRRLGGGRSFRPWWWVPAIWLDPLRGFVGAYLLRRSVAVESPDWALVPKPEYTVILVIVTLSVIAQMFTRRADRDVLLAPIGFVSGMVGALAPWPLALISVITAFLGLFAFREYHAYFGFGVVATLLLGFVLDAPLRWTVPAAAVFGVPVALGLVTSRTLEFPVRDSSGPKDRGHRG